MAPFHGLLTHRRQLQMIAHPKRQSHTVLDQTFLLLGLCGTVHTFLVQVQNYCYFAAISRHFFTQIVIATGMQTITRSARTCTCSIASFQSRTIYVYNNYLSDGLEMLHYYAHENFTIIVTAGSVPGNI